MRAPLFLCANAAFPSSFSQSEIRRWVCLRVNPHDGHSPTSLYKRAARP